MKRPLLTALERDMIRNTDCALRDKLLLHLAVLMVKRYIDKMLTPIIVLLSKLFK